MPTVPRRGNLSNRLPPGGSRLDRFPRRGTVGMSTIHQGKTCHTNFHQVLCIRTREKPGGKPVRKVRFPALGTTWFLPGARVLPTRFPPGISLGKHQVKPCPPGHKAASHLAFPWFFPGGSLTFRWDPNIPVRQTNTWFLPGCQVTHTHRQTSTWFFPGRCLVHQVSWVFTRGKPGFDQVSGKHGK